jgi:hypothetical protein
MSAQAAALSNPAPLSPEVKDLIAEEVKEQVALENNESASGCARMASRTPRPAAFSACSTMANHMSS